MAFNTAAQLNKSFRLLNSANGQKPPPAPFGAGGFPSPKIQWQPQPPLQPPQSRSKATRITPLPSASVISCCMALSLSRPARLSSANFLLFIKTPPQKYYFRRAAKKQSQKLQKLAKILEKNSHKIFSPPQLALRRTGSPKRQRRSSKMHTKNISEHLFCFFAKTVDFIFNLYYTIYRCKRRLAASLYLKEEQPWQIKIKQKLTRRTLLIPR